MMRIFSNGGGVQSAAALVLSAQGKINFPVHVFANVGDDSENPETIKYVAEVMKPYAKKHGVGFYEISKATQERVIQETLYEYINRIKRSIPIPMRLLPTGAPGNRTCTIKFKIEVIDRWIAQNRTGDDVSVGLGITVDEFQRARRFEPEQVRGFTKQITYPLLDVGISRNECLRILNDASLPIPQKSSCWFCPYQHKSQWLQLKIHHPDLFEAAINMEDMLIERRHSLGKDAVYFTDACVPLEDALGGQMMFDELENCESGYCMV